MYLEEGNRFDLVKVGGEVAGLGNNKNRDMEVRNYSALFSEMQSHLARGPSQQEEQVIGDAGLENARVKEGLEF